MDPYPFPLLENPSTLRPTSLSHRPRSTRFSTRRGEKPLIKKLADHLRLSTGRFVFAQIPGNKLPGYDHSVPTGQSPTAHAAMQPPRALPISNPASSIALNSIATDIFLLY